MIIRYLSIVCLSLAMFGYSASGLAGNSQTQLQRIAAQIENIKNGLLKTHNKRDALQQDLNKIETQYGEASQNRQQTEQAILRQKQQIQFLENQSLFSQNQIKLQQQALINQLRLSYLLQSQGAIKLVLNQQDLNQVGRMLYYYQALNTYRIHHIQQLQVNLAKINNQQQQLYIQYQTLQKLQQQQQQQEQNLTQMKTNRTQLLETINQNISDQKQRLSELFANKTRLEKTIAHLSQARVQPVFTHLGQGNFAAQRGHLPWPTKGVVQHYFDTPIAQSELKWNGELIAAPDEQPVYAVASGTVVFSKWMEGYGLLIIINHGNGYMTLYGRNHSLYKREGDKVTAGDLIATVGQSGGYDKPALYFAIRYNAKPLNPNQWCI